MNIVIFGCGQAGRMVLNWLPAGNNPVAYADNDPRKWGTYICQVPVIPPSDLLSFQPDLVWIAVVNREASLSIERQLRGLGYHGLIQSLTPLRERLDLRLACLRLLAEQIQDRDLPGAAAELGVYQGVFAAEISRLFPDRPLYLFDTFEGFSREKKLELVYVCFTDYDETIEHKLVAFKKETITNTFGEYLAAHGKKQLRLAETEKYAHVTFFFNGGVEEPNEGEDRILVPSPKEVATYDLKPEMSAPMVCDKLVEAIGSGKYDVIIVNFANPDMVGHTGVESAAVKAIETVDACVGRAVEAIKAADGVMFICADHGNAEQLVDYETGEPYTAHTTNPVPFILVNADASLGLREGGALCDIVPTLIDLMGMEQPKEMTGKSLLVRK